MEHNSISQSNFPCKALNSQKQQQKKTSPKENPALTSDVQNNAWRERWALHHVPNVSTLETRICTCSLQEPITAGVRKKSISLRNKNILARCTTAVLHLSEAVGVAGGWTADLTDHQVSSAGAVSGWCWRWCRSNGIRLKGLWISSCRSSSGASLTSDPQLKLLLAKSCSLFWSQHSLSI